MNGNRIGIRTEEGITGVQVEKWTRRFKPWRQNIRFPVLVGLLSLLGSLLFYLVFCATVSPRQTDWLEITALDGTTYPLELWCRDPLVPLPFQSNPQTYVRYAGGEMQVSGRGFGNGIAGVLVSPDHRFALIEAHFKNSLYGVVLIDLQTGEMARWDASAGDMTKQGWTRLFWKPLKEEAEES